MKKSKSSVLPVIKRKAIDSTGHIGSLYDIHNDFIFGPVNLNSERKYSQAYKLKHCTITKGNNDYIENILKLVGVDDELRLNMLLNHSEKTGLGAMLDYSEPINENTCFFYYNYFDREETVDDKQTKISNSNKLSKPLKGATHVITGMQTGIDVFIILQLPSNSQLMTQIENILCRFRTLLLSDENLPKLTQEEEYLLTNILGTRTYSNINDLRGIDQIYDVCHYIKKNQKDTCKYPIAYILQPILWLYPFYTGSNSIFISLPRDLSNNIENYLINLSDTIQKLERFIKNDLPSLLCPYLRDRYTNLQQHWVNVYTAYSNEILRLSQLVTHIHHGYTSVSTAEQNLNNDQQKHMQKLILELYQSCNDLMEKGHFIRDLDRLNFAYVNIADYNISSVDNEKSIERIIVMDVQRDRILCSNDVLNKTNPGQLNQLRHGMITELDINRNLRLAYADFSYCSYPLQKMIKLPLNNNTNTTNNKEQQKFKNSARTYYSDPISPTRLLTILLPNIHNINIKVAQPQIDTSPRKKPFASVASSIDTAINRPKSTREGYSIREPPINSSEIHPFSRITQTSTISSARDLPDTSKSNISPRKTQISTLSSVRDLPDTSKSNISPRKTQTSTISSARDLPDTSESNISPRKTQISTLSSVRDLPDTSKSNISPRKTQTSTISSARDLPDTSESNISPRKTQIISGSSTFDSNTINILLLGETGVGKSTFINALANYLIFPSLQKAQVGKPAVLMPVSFTLTTGDNFDEHIVRFGDVNDSTNEDFRHPGQSVTQHCKSYVFHLNDDKQTKLRIIDTPGFGDTRGVEQDDRNMEHILEYINNLTHLNAICFLLKPNASRLNIFFRSCLTQLFSLLSQNALNNIIFCFTNARSTFYTPGDTAPLLKEMLKSLSIGDVPFKKENTFCFDSESFRYLVALQNKIRFDDNEKQEYERSWTTSVAQSKRLIDYIQRDMIVYRLDKDLQTTKRAEYDILRMVRPMLETMRNILRNLILHKLYSPEISIELYPRLIDRPTAVCLQCEQRFQQIGKFLIALDFPHQLDKQCHTCHCPLNEHISIDYILEYKSLKKSMTYNFKEILSGLVLASAEFSYFLIYAAHVSETDLFLSKLSYMIQQENNLANSQQTNEMNLELIKALNELKRGYEKRMNELKSIKTIKSFSFIYKRIKNIGEYPMIREQMAAIKESVARMMKDNEYEVPKVVTN